MDGEIILAKDIPTDVIRSAMQEISFYTITFLTEGGIPDAELAGSGVLVKVGKTRAILTADHVAQPFKDPQLGRIPVFLERTTQPHSIDKLGVTIRRVGRGSKAERGPDLAVILLSPSVASSLEAKKSFFPLDKHRDGLLSEPPGLRDGAWLVQGFVNERTVVLPDAEGGTNKFFYNFTGVGGPEIVEEDVDGFDIYDYPVDMEARSEAPRDFGGMSGSGIWQMKLRRKDGVVVHEAPVLSGTIFYQVARTETQCGIRGHGRRSVYGRAYQQILGP